MLENYKGIMLCQRPQESINLDYHKPFVSRVTHQEPIGYNPVKQLQIHKPIKSVKPVLRKHKEWLNKFERTVKEKKNGMCQSQLVQSQGQQQTEIRKQTRFEDDYNQQPEQPEQIDQQQQQQQQSDEEMMDNDVEELINFTKGLDYESYMNDLEFKTVVEALKQRIVEIQATKKSELKSNTNTPNKQKQKKLVLPSIKLSEAEKEIQPKESTIEQLAKRLAEDILQRNKYLRNIHSHISMQRLVETEARRYIEKS